MNGFEFERELGHPCAGAIFDVNHQYSEQTFDELIIIRCIEQNKEEIAKDPMFLFPFTNLYGTEKENDEKLNTMKYLYKNYCSTTCYDLSKVNNSYIRDAINLAFLHS